MRGRRGWRDGASPTATANGATCLPSITGSIGSPVQSLVARCAARNDDDRRWRSAPGRSARSIRPGLRAPARVRHDPTEDVDVALRPDVWDCERLGIDAIDQRRGISIAPADPDRSRASCSSSSVRRTPNRQGKADRGEERPVVAQIKQELEAAMDGEHAVAIFNRDQRVDRRGIQQPPPQAGGTLIARQAPRDDRAEPAAAPQQRQHSLDEELIQVRVAVCPAADRSRSRARRT